MAACLVAATIAVAAVNRVTSMMIAATHAEKSADKHSQQKTAMFVHGGFYYGNNMGNMIK